MEQVAWYRQLLEAKQSRSVRRLRAQWEAQLQADLRRQAEQLLAYVPALGYELLAAELQRVLELAAVEERW